MAPGDPLSEAAHFRSSQYCAAHSSDVIGSAEIAWTFDSTSDLSTINPLILATSTQAALATDRPDAPPSASAPLAMRTRLLVMLSIVVAVRSAALVCNSRTRAFTLAVASNREAQASALSSDFGLNPATR